MHEKNLIFIKFWKSAYFLSLLFLYNLQRENVHFEIEDPLSLVCYKEVIDKILLDFFVFWFAVTEAVRNYKSLKTFSK